MSVNSVLIELFIRYTIILINLITLVAFFDLKQQISKLLRQFCWLLDSDLYV